jgi:hypothetical protein
VKRSKFTEAQIAFGLKQAEDGAPIGQVSTDVGATVLGCVNVHLILSLMTVSVVASPHRWSRSNVSLTAGEGPASDVPPGGKRCREYFRRRWSGTERGIRSDAVAVSQPALDEN